MPQLDHYELFHNVAIEGELEIQAQLNDEPKLPNGNRPRPLQEGEAARPVGQR